MISRQKLSAICLSIVMSYFPNVVHAQSTPMGSNTDKYGDWKENILPKYQAYKSYYSTSNEVLERAKPGFNGWVFFLRDYNQETFRTVTDVVTHFETSTIVTTNTTVSSNTYFNTTDFFNSSVTTSSMNGMDWISARANYLENNFGMTHSDALSNAIADRNFCESNPADCASRTYTTNYILESIGPDTTVHSNPTTVDINHTTDVNTTTTHNGHTTVTTTTTNNSTITNTTDSTTETTTQGSRDIITNATGANGGTDGNVDTATTTDERITTDETTNATTTTDNTTETKTDRTTETASTRRVKQDRYWDVQISPMIFFSLDYDRAITNLDQYYPSVNRITFGENGNVLSAKSSTSASAILDGGMNHAEARAVPEIHIGNYNGPFRVKIKHSAMLGVGASLNFVQVNASGISAYIIPYVGVAPIGGISAESERAAPNLKTAKSIDGLKLPKDLASLKTWNTFDKLTYSTNGGVLFIAGVAMPMLNFGSHYVANGTWSTEVQKVGDGKVYVKLNNTTLNTLSIFASATLAQVSLSHFNMLNNSFSYMFDLNEGKALQAYLQLIKGNVTEAQKLADDKSVKSVIRVESSNVRSAGKIRSFRLGIPFMNINTSKATIASAEMSDYHPDGSKINADYGIFMREKNSHMFGTNTTYNYGFYGAAFESQSNTTKKTETGVFGMIGWSFKNNDVDEGRLSKAVKRLVHLTGMRNELLVNVTGGNPNKGFASVEFSMKFDPQATRTLQNIAAQDKSAGQLSRIANGFIDAAISDEGKDAAGRALVDELLKEYAPQTQSNDSRAPTMSREARIRLARSQAKKETASALNDMTLALSNMNNTTDRKVYVREYAAFGKAMLQNQFAFQTAFNLIKGRGVSARYTITGEQIKAYDLSFDWQPVAKEVTTIK